MGGAAPGGEEVIVDLCQSWVTPWKIHGSYVVKVVGKAHSVLQIQEAEAASGSLKAVQTVVYVHHGQIYWAMSEMCLHELQRRAHCDGPEQSLASIEFLRVLSHFHHPAVIAFVSRARL